MAQGYNDTRKGKSMGGGFNLKDNTQDGEVKKIKTDAEKYDLSRVKKYSCGSKGYPKEAWNYKY